MRIPILGYPLTKIMKKLNSKKIIFWTLIIIGIVVRIYNFPHAINEMNCDEIMTVVNAKSIAETGKETGGISLPVYLHGWGGQSVILLYLMAISIKLMGYTLFAARLPLLLISIISMFVFYDLVNKISKNTNVALVALGLLAICPWHILQAIWGLDCNMFPHFLLIAIDLLYTGISNKSKIILYSSMIFFAISLYGYGVAIYFVPLFLLIVSIYLLKTKELKIKDVIICIAIFLIIAMPIITMFAINALHIDKNIKIGIITIPYYESLSRTKDMIFFTPKPLEQLFKNISSTIKVVFAQIDGAEWNSSPVFGTTYRITMIFAIIGLIEMIKQIKKDHKNIENVILISWISISILTGFIVNQANINRLNSIWYVLLILAAYGIYKIYEQVKNKKIYIVIVTCLYTIIFIAFIIYFYSYHVKIVDQSGCFSRGFYQALSYVKTLDEKIVIYDNIKGDGCLQMYIELNGDSTKKYDSIRNEDELKDKIENISENEIIIVDVEYKDYPNTHSSKQIGDFMIITK